MSLRLMEIFAPGVEGNRIVQVLQERPKVSIWTERGTGANEVVRAVVPVEATDGILDLLDQHFGDVEGFRVIILRVEATFPRPEEPEEEDGEGDEHDTPSPGRLSREELYADVSEASRVTRTYVLLMTLAGVVAALGLHLNNVAVIIGAMVIAPLLGPNVGLALATTLGDGKLARRAVQATLLGFGLAVAVGAVFGWVLQTPAPTPAQGEIFFRTQIRWEDILLAVAAGGAGTIAFTAGVATVIVGVMVAVALLPPMVTLGMLLGAGHWDPALGAFLLVVAYLVGINLAGVSTFVARGVRPMTWWEEEKARRATRLAIPLWALLLLLLLFLSPIF